MTRDSCVVERNRSDRMPLNLNTIPCCISHTLNRVQPAPWLFHHGVPWSISICCGNPLTLKTSSNVARTPFAAVCCCARRPNR